jgi:hypothetical protein
VCVFVCAGAHVFVQASRTCILLLEAYVLTLHNLFAGPAVYVVVAVCCCRCSHHCTRASRLVIVLLYTYYLAPAPLLSACVCCAGPTHCRDWHHVWRRQQTVTGAYDLRQCCSKVWALTTCWVKCVYVSLCVSVSVRLCVCVSQAGSLRGV